MEELNIGFMNLGDDGFAAIASCVTNIDKLWIGSENDTKLTIKGIRALAQEISKRNKPVSYQHECIFHTMKSLAEYPDVD